MILSCPECGSRFRIDADKLGMRGRKVRCSRCAHTWRATPEDGEPEETPQASPEAQSAEAAPATAPEPETPRPEPEEAAPQPSFESFEDVRQRVSASRRERPAPPREPESRGRRFAPVLGWAVFVLVVIGIVAGAWFGRHGIVERFPRAAALYDMVGVPVSTVAPGLELRDVRRERETVEGTSFLIISGEIRNTGKGTRAVPALQVTLYDAQGTELVSWRVAADDAALPPGGSTTFRTRRADPPTDARELSLTFARPSS